MPGHNCKRKGQRMNRLEAVILVTFWLAGLVGMIYAAYHGVILL